MTKNKKTQDANIVNFVTRYTTAPKIYDGFGTVRTGYTIQIINGTRVEEVQILCDYLEWQENRYGSGLHLCLDEEKLKEYE